MLLDFVTDPNELPIPPHVNFEQAKHLMFALERGDPERGSVDHVRGTQRLHEHVSTTSRTA